MRCGREEGIVEGDSRKIRMSGQTIEPRSQGVVSIDISEGYDVKAVEENLPEGDWYYFVLTNNNFAFGQDWMCSFDFEIEQTEDVMDRSADFMEQVAEEREQRTEENQYDTILCSCGWSGVRDSIRKQFRKFHCSGLRRWRYR